MAKISVQRMRMPRACGTISAYAGGCRCAPCRRARSDYMKTWAKRPHLGHKKHPCGTRGAYLRGCRCQGCEAASSVYIKKWDTEHAALRYKMNRAWRDANPERASQMSRNWKAANPHKVDAQRQNYDYRMISAPGSATAEQIRARVAYFGGTCSYCGGAYEHLDHAIPLSRGGTNWPANRRPACASCNLSKRTMTVLEFRNKRAGLIVK